MDLNEYKIKVLPMQDKLLGFSKRLLGEPEEARDTVQEVFLKLWNLREKLGQYRNLEAFAMTVTRNHCLDKIKARRTVRLEEKHYNSIDFNSDPSPGELLERKDAAGYVKEIIQALPENQRSVIHLRDVEGYENEEIAKIMDMDVNNIRVILSRTRKKVRVELLKKYYSNENSGHKESIRKVL